MGAVRLSILTVLFGAGSIAWSTPADTRQVEVNAWESPRSGWLYVVDPDFNDESRIWLFDKELMLFEPHTERSRRGLFFARCEAEQIGHVSVDGEDVPGLNGF